MRYSKRLKISSACRNISTLLPYVLITIILSIYIVVKKSYLTLFILIPLLVYFFIKNKSLLILYIIIFLFILSNLFIISINLKGQSSYINGTVKVYKVTNYTDYQKVYVKKSINLFNTVKTYFISTNYFYSSGDILYIEGNIEPGSYAHTEGGFNYNDYLYYQKIKGKLIPDNIEIVNHKPCLYTLHEKIEKYINTKFKSKTSQVMLALVIGEKSNMSDDLKAQISKLGIGHLFVISGLHMQIISSICFFLLKKVKIKDQFKNLIVLSILLFYYWVTYFMVSILRVILSFILNKVLVNELSLFTPLDKLSINALIVLLINPLYLFSYSFLLSYTVVFGILLIGRFLRKEKGIKSFIINSFLISASSLIISMPIVSNISNDINLLSIIFNLFYIPFVSYILLPLSFITLFIPPLNVIYEFIINIFLNVSNALSKVNILDITIPKISLIPSIIYYILYLLIISKLNKQLKKRIIFSFLLFILIWINISYISINNKIYFLDLPKGDALFIEQPHNVNDILIDTGDYDAEELISFLKRKGIRKINSIFITHADSDHIGGLKSLVEKFRIKNIFISYFDTDSLKLIKKLNFKNTNLIYLYPFDTLKIGKATIDVLWPYSASSNNNYNSLVLLIDYLGLKILDVGDLTKEAEANLIKKTQLLKCDILKVGHHGSKTSSSIEFLKKIKPKLAVAMNGYNNTFGFPNEEIVNRYKSLGINMMNTKEFGSIIIYKRFNNIKLKYTYKRT